MVHILSLQHLPAPQIRCHPAARQSRMSRGNTTIVAPGGEIIAGPLIGEVGTLSATIDLDRIAAGRRIFDPVGHYARPDVLALDRPVHVRS